MGNELQIEVFLNQYEKKSFLMKVAGSLMSTLLLYKNQYLNVATSYVKESY